MSSTHSHVVVAFDFTHSGRAALTRAITLAARAPFHVLHFVCAIEPHTRIPSIAETHSVGYQYAEEVQRALTAEIERELRATDHVVGQIQFFVHARIGTPVDEILMVAREVGADLIITGSKGVTGLERVIVGSVSERVVREAGCTVEVARAKTYPDVNLLQVVDTTEAHHKYVPPHRYTYENRNLNLRPTDWPLY